MEIADAFKFCPRCSGVFVKKGDYYLKCSGCSYNYFINPAPCASAVLRSEHGILIVKRKDEPYKGTWQTPGGFMHPHEDVYEALERELMEELGTTALVGDMIASLEGVYPYGGLNLPFIAMYYRGEINPDEVHVADDAEEHAWINLENFKDYTITYKNLERLIESELKGGLYERNN